MREQHELDYDEDPATDDAHDARRYFYLCPCRSMSLILYVLFVAAPHNSTAALLDRWRVEIRAEVATVKI